jgi:hypothetical protein
VERGEVSATVDGLVIVRAGQAPREDVELRRFETADGADGGIGQAAADPGEEDGERSIMLRTRRGWPLPVEGKDGADAAEEEGKPGDDAEYDGLEVTGLARGEEPVNDSAR